MLIASLGAYAPAAQHFQNDPRVARFAAEHKKLATAAKNYAYATPGLVALGEDPVVEQLLSAAGFPKLDAYVLRLIAWGSLVTAICVPTRVWREPECRSVLREIKAQAAENLTKCILVPQWSAKAEVRATVARVLATARHTTFDRDDKNRVLDHLDAKKISTIGNAAALLRDHDDPVGAVLAMACTGHIDVDRSRILSGSTWISRPRRLYTYVETCR